MTDLSAALAEHGIQPGKSNGVMVIRADAVATARAAAEHTEPGGEGSP